MKALSPKERKTKEQFDRHPHMPNKGSSWERESYPHYKAAKVPYQPKDTHVEFGKAFDVSVVLTADDLAIKAAYDMALTDFLKEKKVNFPNWNGLPEIKINNGGDPLKRMLQIGWYAKVPKEFVISPDDRLEEDLWNS